MLWQGKGWVQLARCLQLLMEVPGCGIKMEFGWVVLLGNFTGGEKSSE